MTKKKKEDSKEIRVKQIQLCPNAKQMQHIDIDMLHMQRLYNFIISHINGNNKYLKDKHPVFAVIYDAIEAIMPRFDELTKLKEKCEKDNEIFSEELEKELDDLTKELEKHGKKKYAFYREHPDSLVRFEINSKRIVVHLAEDGVTPLSDNVELCYAADGRPYYISNKTYYTELPGSSRYRKDGTSTVIMCECAIKSVKMNEDKTVKEKVYSDCAILKYEKNKKDDDKKDNSKDKYCTILIHKELLRLDNDSNGIKSFFGKFAREFVFSVQKNPNTKKTQKTGMRYIDYGFTARDFDYGLGERIIKSFEDFPKTRNHAIATEFNLVTQSDQGTKMKVIKKDDGKFYLKYKVSKFNPKLKYSDVFYNDGHYVYTDILILPCMRNKARLNTELDADTDVLEAVLNKTQMLNVIRTEIRRIKKYTLIIPMDSVKLKKKVYGENAMNQKLGKGIVGIDPNMHQLAAFSRNLNLFRMFSIESVDYGRIYKKFVEIETEINKIDEQMGRSLRECNLEHVDPETKGFKKGCGRLLYKSQKYLNLQIQKQELERKRSELKKWTARIMAHEILGMGDTVYSELPMSGKAREKKDPKQDKNGKWIRTNPFARSIQRFSIGGMVDLIRDLFVSRGGKWIWIDNFSSCTKHMIDEIAHGMGDRVLTVCGFKFQRDLKSAMCMAYAKKIVPVMEKKVVKHADGTKEVIEEQKMAHGFPVYHIEEFDDEALKRDIKKLYESNLNEMERMRSLNVEDDSIAVEEYFAANNKQMGVLF